MTEPIRIDAERFRRLALVEGESPQQVEDLTDEEIRAKAGQVMDSLEWMREFLRPESRIAHAFDEIRAFADGQEPTP